MAKRDKIFYLANRDMKLVEVKFPRLKFFGAILFSVFVSLSIITAVNHLLSDVLSLGYDRANTLQRENDALRNHLGALTTRIKDIQESMNRLSSRDNQLRLAVDLPTIDPDVRQVGAGGRVQMAELGISSSELSQLVQKVVSSVDKLDAQVRLEGDSYSEISKRYDVNRSFFEHLPSIKPCAGYYNPESFGMREHPLLHIERMHEGLDIITDVGTPVHVTGDGIVDFAGHGPGGYGIVIEIDHGFGYRTLYAHLFSVAVRQGDHVKRGQTIGTSGNTGLSAGPHLHYEVVKNGKKINPVDYFFDEIQYARR